MKELLLPFRAGEDPLYTILRDSSEPNAAERREFVARLWALYHPIAPKGFAKKLQFEFCQRWWEMYLAVAILRLGWSPRCSKSDKGPDILLELDGSPLYLEAVAPTVGTKSDQVPNHEVGGCFEFPERECLLRLAQGVIKKRDMLEHYMNIQLISSVSPCVIALSACALNQFGILLEGKHPAPLSILAGAGHPVITIGGAHPPYTSHRGNLSRDSGSPVNTCLFNTPEFRIVSGVLYSPIDLWNVPDEPERTISLFLNPKPNVRLPASFQSRFVTWSEARTNEHEATWSRTLPMGSPYS